MDPDNISHRGSRPKAGSGGGATRSAAKSTQRRNHSLCPLPRTHIPVPLPSAQTVFHTSVVPLFRNPDHGARSRPCRHTSPHHAAACSCNSRGSKRFPLSHPPPVCLCCLCVASFGTSCAGPAQPTFLSHTVQADLVVGRQWYSCVHAQPAHGTKLSHVPADLVVGL